MELIDDSDEPFRYMVSVGSTSRIWVEIRLTHPTAMYQEFENHESIARQDMVKAFREGHLGLVFNSSRKEPDEEEVDLIESFIDVLASRRHPARMISGYTTTCTRVVKHPVKEDYERRRFS